MEDRRIRIGEAKTARDLYTVRSAHQLRAFVRAIIDDRRGMFVLVVPFHALAEARAFLHSFVSKEHLDRIVCIGQEEYFDRLEAS